MEEARVLSLSLSKGTRVKTEEGGGKVERTLASPSSVNTPPLVQSRRRVCTCARRYIRARSTVDALARSWFQAVKAKEYMKETLITALLASQP